MTVFCYFALAECHEHISVVSGSPPALLLVVVQPVADLCASHLHLCSQSKEERWKISADIQQSLSQLNTHYFYTSNYLTSLHCHLKQIPP